MRELKPRSPLAAMLLSAHIPGLGQMYNGELVMGVLMVAGASAGVAGLFGFGILHGVRGLAWGTFLLALFFTCQIADAGFGASKRFDYTLKWYNRASWYAAYTAIFIVCAGLVLPSFVKKYNPLTIYAIPSESMVPALLEGDLVLADVQAFSGKGPQRWDVILFSHPKDPDQTLIKRVAGLPGESLEIRGRNLLINGQSVPDVYAHSGPSRPSAARPPEGDAFGPIDIPPGHYFVLGDNRNHSTDSRHFGMVDETLILARARLILFSWDLSRAMVQVP